MSITQSAEEKRAADLLSATPAIAVQDDEAAQQQSINDNLDNITQQNSLDRLNSDIPSKIAKDTEETGDENVAADAVPISDDEDIDETIPPLLEEVDANLQQHEELDEINIAKEISNYMNVNRVNIGEIDSLEEMWSYCDAISAAHSGLPDSLLKEAFIIVLEGNYGHAPKHTWMRQHLEHLIRMWKKEMLNERSFSRPTKFVSASATYSPPYTNMQIEDAVNEQRHKEGQKQSENEKVISPNATTLSGIEKRSSEDWAKLRRQRKQAAKRKRALATIMGVGQMLEHARRKFATEEGELDIDEDEYGNFMIGGMELTFESWGQLNKIKEAGVVHSKATAAKRRKSSGMQQKNGNGIALNKQFGQLQDAPQPPKFDTEQFPKQAKLISMAEQYPTVGEVEMPNEQLYQNKIDKKNEKQNQPIEEKDEGEISDSDETTSSSSDGSDETDELKRKRRLTTIQRQKENQLQQIATNSHSHQNRRRARREEERQQGASSAQNLQTLLKKCFDLRSRIVRKLSIQQKAMFMDLLKQSKAGTLHQNVQQQHQILAQLMSSTIQKNNN